jgi:hypothetical protein
MKKLTCILLSGMALMFTACADHTNTPELINNKASLPPTFDFDKMGLKVMTSSVNKKQATMATLYANELALKTAPSGSKAVTAGKVLALITWKQQPDGHWFGGNIPGELQSVELLKTVDAGGKGTTINYQKFEGKTLSLSRDTSQNQARIKYLLEQQPSVLP